MKQNILELWVGVFVAIGIVAIAFLSLRVVGGNQHFSEQKSYILYASFNNIGGLKVNAPVKSAGVVVGRVRSIGLDPKTYRAKVSFAVGNQYHFSTDTSAQILTSGILGEQYIGLQEGGDMDNLANGDTITITSSAIVLENLLGQFMTNFAEKKAQ